MEKIYKKRTNYYLIYFEVFYALYIGILLFEKQYTPALVVLGAGLVIAFYFNCMRPYRYRIERKTLYIDKRIGKSREINLMTAETITDVIPKLTKLSVNPRAIEIYLEGGKRVTVVPKYRLEFVQDVVLANKRIKVSVDEFQKNRKSFEKKQRKIQKQNRKKGIVENADE